MPPVTEAVRHSSKIKSKTCHSLAGRSKDSWEIQGKSLHTIGMVGGAVESQMKDHVACS